MIKVNDNIYIDADRNSFKVREFGVNENGDPTDTILAYCPSLKSTLNYIVKLKTRDYVSKTEASTLKELVAEVDKITKELENLINEEI